MKFKEFQRKCRYRVPQSFGNYKCRLLKINTHGQMDGPFDLGPCPRTREDRCLEWKKIKESKDVENKESVDTEIV